MFKYLKTITFLFFFFVIYTCLINVVDSYKSRDISIYQYQTKIEQNFDHKTYKTIILGDSRALAINYSADSHADIYNYSFSNAGGLYPYPYFLEKYLHRNAPPRKIIWSFIPLMLTDEWEIFQDNIEKRDSELERAAFLYQVSDILFPLFQNIFWRNPATLENILKKKIDINFKYLKNYFIEDYDPQHNQKLFNEKTGGLIFAESVRWQYSSDTYLENVPFTIGENSTGFIKKFMDMAQANNIHVYVFNMPIPSSTYKKRIEQGFYEKYFAYFAKIKREYPDNLFINPNILHYEDRFFVDGSHLNQWGAELFQQSDYSDLLQWINSL